MNVQRKAERLNWTELETRFAVRQHDLEGKLLFACRAEQLADPETMRQLLDIYGQRIKALEPAAAAAYLAGWFGYAALAQLYSCSIYDTALSFTPEQLELQLYEKGDYAVFSFKLLGPELQQSTTHKEPPPSRAEWLQQTWVELYGRTLRPMLEAAAAATGTDVGSLWGQLPTRFNYTVPLWLEETHDEELQAIIKDDYRRLCLELPADVFGRSRNPLDVKVRLIEDMKDSSKQVKMKNACCLYYQTEGGTYCYTCPRMTEAQRAERRAEARLAQQQAAQ
ncbi:(2Fe-2S)-binding protein [Paenibacillus sp. YYML68]|uniref:(2Fe-2S)-binding protein n=1 Tax=Paenibacillus sp. YYML68 TaxID=2909250 RepID=UPI0024939150|nr:(2Fe-2S)-binding protein [Paenibacillus sp. YYML68]